MTKNPEQNLIDYYEKRIETLEDAIANIKRHEKVEAFETPFCFNCLQDWPCPTQKAHTLIDPTCKTMPN